MKEEYKVLVAIWILYGVFLAVRGINDLILLFLVTAFVIVFTLEIRENGIGPKEKET
ncbi:MAG: hypothetical protein QMD61_03220 [Methanobacterium sp.]|nr:hypothetical protein [Methanobacterium sp.]